VDLAADPLLFPAPRVGDRGLMLVYAGIIEQITGEYTMGKIMWTTLLVIGLATALLLSMGLGVLAQTRAAPDSAVITFTNDAPDVPAIDVYIDRNLVIAGLSNTDPAVMIQVASGDHLVDVVPAGADVVLIKTTDLVFETDHSYGLTLAGQQADWSVALVVTDDTVR
jgi:hypothetical protein